MVKPPLVSQQPETTGGIQRNVTDLLIYCGMLRAIAKRYGLIVMFKCSVVKEMVKWC